MEQWRRIDAASAAEALALLTAACGSTAWVDRMLARRPFGSREALLDAARAEWFALEPGEWLEAFSHHPKIGERTADRMAATEQAGVNDATQDILTALADANRSYEAKFGYIFIVCATGKTAVEMLALLRERLPNNPASEIRIAADEQAKITALRLLAP
jgi:2-oxo-4-hydroxy-4-carboxy-5-ureidoimidazoline decarboxylase